MNELTTATQNRIAQLRTRASSEAVEIWQPETGAMLCGEYIGHKTIEHPRYGQQWQLLLKDETGTIYAVWLNTWLKQNLKAQDLAIGDLVALSFFGKKTTQAGNEYNAYGIVVDKS